MLLQLAYRVPLLGDSRGFDVERRDLWEVYECCGCLRGKSHFVEVHHWTSNASYLHVWILLFYECGLVLQKRQHWIYPCLHMYESRLSDNNGASFYHHVRRHIDCSLPLGE